jgi:hypothetical protein
MKFKQFRFKIFLLALMVIGLITIISFIGAVAVEESDNQNILLNTADKIFHVFKLPIQLFVGDAMTGLLFVLVINPILYSFLVERIISMRKTAL